MFLGGKSTQTLVVEAQIAGESEDDVQLDIINLYMSSEPLSRLQSMFRHDREDHLYCGPDYSILEEPIKRATLDFLTSCGITEDLLLFCEDYTTNKLLL